MRQASCDTVWDSLSLTAPCIFLSVYFISLVFPIPRFHSFSCLSVFPQHAPGVPRILVGNRLHLAFKRQVPTEQARAYAEKNGMTFFEVSPLCNFNVIESFTELSRIVLMRHGMEKFWRPNRGEVQGLPDLFKGMVHPNIKIVISPSTSLFGYFLWAFQVYTFANPKTLTKNRTAVFKLSYY